MGACCGAILELLAVIADRLSNGSSKRRRRLHKNARNTGEVLQKERDSAPHIMADYAFENDPAKLRVKAVFDAKKGKLHSKRSNRLLVSVKDPFIKELNYGFEMREKERLKQLITVLKSFLKAALTNLNLTGDASQCLCFFNEPDHQLH